MPFCWIFPPDPSSDEDTRPVTSLELFATSSFDELAPATFTSGAEHAQVFVQVAAAVPLDLGVRIHANRCWLENAVLPEDRVTILENKFVSLHLDQPSASQLVILQFKYSTHTCCYCLVARQTQTRKFLRNPLLVYASFSTLESCKCAEITSSLAPFVSARISWRTRGTMR